MNELCLFQLVPSISSIPAKSGHEFLLQCLLAVSDSKIKLGSRTHHADMLPVQDASLMRL